MPANTVRVAAFADVERELEQLVGAVDVLGIDDRAMRRSILAKSSIGDRARVAPASPLAAARSAAAAAARRAGAARPPAAFEQRVDLLRVDARHQVRVRADRASGVVPRVASRRSRDRGRTARARRASRVAGSTGASSTVSSWKPLQRTAMQIVCSSSRSRRVLGELPRLALRRTPR